MSSSDMSEWASEDDEPTLVRPIFKSKTEEAEWERKQRNREYRVASRREKRLRKADEKKQRKLNATILRRMTKNPEKYNKNIDRNRRREIDLERRKIYKEAVSQAERLAAIHDPSGKVFNVGPVVVQEGGKVVSIELLERRAIAQAERSLKIAQGVDDGAAKSNGEHIRNEVKHDGVNPARRQLIEVPKSDEIKVSRISKTQQKKMAMLEARPPPPKPVIPEGIKLPEGEENWVSLWDLSEDELERRVIREKKRKAAERKALREKQKEGKAERRAARDERRKVYREKKLEWKAIKEEEKRQKKKLLHVEQEEAKRIEIAVNLAERRRALEICAELGFTLENVEGVDEIKPRALGMKGQEVDFSVLEIGERPSHLRVLDEQTRTKGPTRGNRVDLGRAVDEDKAKMLTLNVAQPADIQGDFVSLEFGGVTTDGQPFEALNYNHKLRRKLHRAIEAAQIQKELLVRAKAKEHCEKEGIEVPVELANGYRQIKLSGRRILEDGTAETEKQERVRKRLELAEYNKAAKVLRRQAKAEAIEAGLRVFAELTGKKVNGEQGHPMEATQPTLNGGVDENMEPGDTMKCEISKKRGLCEDEAEVPPKSKKPKKDSNDRVEAKKSRKSKNESSLGHDLAHDEEVDASQKKRKSSKTGMRKQKTLSI